MICYSRFVFNSSRQMKLNNELNNMSWRVRPDDVLLEVGRLYGSKVGLQKLNAEVGKPDLFSTTNMGNIKLFLIFRTFLCNNMAFIPVELP